MPINFGILQPDQSSDTSKVQTASAAPSGDPTQGLGGLLKGLSSLFGTNPVQQTNQAISKSLGSTNPAQIAQQALNLPTQPQTQSPSNTAKQALTPQSLQPYVQQAFPNDPVRQQLAMAQATQESGLLGNPSKLATQNNNLFGMKGAGTNGSVNMPTNEVVNGQNTPQQAGFASYKSPQDSVNAYKDLLNTSRYKGVLQAKTFNEAADAVYKAGYATDPNYSKNLQNVNSRLGDMNTASATKASKYGDPTQVASQFLGNGNKNHADTLSKFFQKSGVGNVNPQTTPWCAAFANSVLKQSGMPGTNSLAAKSFLKWGTPTDNPTKGDVVVYNSMSGGGPDKGHVGFYDSTVTKNGKQYIRTLGGNQDGQVEYKDYPASKVAGFRQPPTAQQMQQMVAQNPPNN